MVTTHLFRLEKDSINTHNKLQNLHNPASMQAYKFSLKTRLINKNCVLQNQETWQQIAWKTIKETCFVIKSGGYWILNSIACHDDVMLIAGKHCLHKKGKKIKIHNMVARFMKK